MPEQLFYNTGIATYVWLVTNCKLPARRGKVQLIDASSFWLQMRRSLGDKRREIPFEQAREIVKILAEFRDGETRKVRKDGKEEEVVVSRISPTTVWGGRLQLAQELYDRLARPRWRRPLDRRRR